jgi:hypothetical protein
MHKPAAKVSTRLSVDFWSVDLVRWLSSIGIVDADAHTKRLPRRIFMESVEDRVSFVRGLFDSDGYVPDPQEENPSIHLCQKPLLMDIKILLRSLGVESSLWGPSLYKGRLSWRLSVFNRMLREVLDGPQKIWPRIKMPVPKFLIAPFVDALSGKRMRDFPSASGYALYKRLVNGGNISVYSFNKLVELMGVDLGQPLYAYRFLTKKEELEQEAETFTLAVKDPLHRFDSEGVISKNTGADGLKASLAIVYRRLKKYGSNAKMVHMVHDEILAEVRDEPELLLAVKKDLEEGMVEGMQPLLKAVPVTVEGAIGASWGEAH